MNDRQKVINLDQKDIDLLLRALLQYEYTLKQIRRLFVVPDIADDFKRISKLDLILREER